MTRFIFLNDLLQETLKIYKVPDMSFIVCYEDNIIENMYCGYLGAVYNENCNCIPIPINWCHYFSNSSKRFNINLYDNIILNYRKYSNILTHEKSNQIIFRGTFNNKRNLLLKYSNYIKYRKTKILNVKKK